MNTMPIRALSLCAMGLTVLSLGACGSDTPAFRENALPEGMPATVQDADATASHVPASTQGSEDNLPHTGGEPAADNPAGDEDTLVAACSKEAMLARSKQVVDLSWAPRQLEEGMSVTLENRSIAYSGELGSVVMATATSLRYTAPQGIGTPAEIALVVSRAGSAVGECLVRLVPDESIGIHDDGTTRGLVGSVYTLVEDTQRLPDFAAMVPVGDIVVQNLDVPNRAFDYGFPGVDETLIEWFGIRFEGVLAIENAGAYEFRLTSDDGARLVIDDELVVDNDGQHAVRSVNGTAQLTRGMHTLRVDYFQGPRYHIALQLLWRPAGSGAAFTIVPPEVLSRPATSP